MYERRRKLRMPKWTICSLAQSKDLVDNAKELPGIINVLLTGMKLMLLQGQVCGF